MKKNQQLEKIMLQDPAEEYLIIRNILHIHLTTKVVREVLGQFISIPIGGNKNWPDLLIFMGLGKTFFVEFKLPGKKLTDGQKELFKKLESIEYKVNVINKIENFVKLIEGKRSCDKIKSSLS